AASARSSRLNGLSAAKPAAHKKRTSAPARAARASAIMETPPIPVRLGDSGGLAKDDRQNVSGSWPGIPPPGRVRDGGGRPPPGGRVGPTDESKTPTRLPSLRMRSEGNRPPLSGEYARHSIVW